MCVAVVVGGGGGVGIFNLSNRSYNLRNSDNFLIPRINTTTYGKHSINSGALAREARQRSAMGKKMT